LPWKPYPVDWRTGGRGDLIKFSIYALDGLGRVEIAMREWIGLSPTGLRQNHRVSPGPAEQ